MYRAKRCIWMITPSGEVSKYYFEINCYGQYHEHRTMGGDGAAAIHRAGGSAAGDGKAGCARIEPGGLVSAAGAKGGGCGGAADFLCSAACDAGGGVVCPGAWEIAEVAPDYASCTGVVRPPLACAGVVFGERGFPRFFARADGGGSVAGSDAGAAAGAGCGVG